MKKRLIKKRLKQMAKFEAGKSKYRPRGMRTTGEVLADMGMQGTGNG